MTLRFGGGKREIRLKRAGAEIIIVGYSGLAENILCATRTKGCLVPCVCLSISSATVSSVRPADNAFLAQEMVTASAGGLASHSSSCPKPRSCAASDRSIATTKGPANEARNHGELPRQHVLPVFASLGWRNVCSGRITKQPSAVKFWKLVQKQRAFSIIIHVTHVHARPNKESDLTASLLCNHAHPDI